MSSPAPGLLLDECVDRSLAVPAFAPHRPIVFTRDLAPRASDHEILKLARERGDILVTEDVGFGRLIFQKQFAPPVGVILIALDPMPRGERGQYLAARASDALARTIGSLVSIGPRRLRARSFPSQA